MSAAQGTAKPTNIQVMAQMILESEKRHQEEVAALQAALAAATEENGRHREESRGAGAVTGRSAASVVADEALIQIILWFAVQVAPRRQFAPRFRGRAWRWGRR